MKKLLLSIVALCVTASIDAACSVTGPDADGVVTVTNQSGGDCAGLTNAQIAQLAQATTLKLVGPFVEDPDFLKLRDACKPTTLDLSDAIIAPGNVTYTYYYLNLENNDRSVLSHDSNGWYYTKNGSRVNVAEKDVRIYTATVSGGQKLPDAWKNCLQKLYLPTDPNYTVTGYSFANGFKNLTSVNIPNNIQVLGYGTFYETGLTSVELPNSIIAICDRAFYKCPLTTFTVPYSVEVMMEYALGECTNLETLIFAANNPDDPDHHLIIKAETLNDLNSVRDVYIQTNAWIDCENHGFDFSNTYSHGQADSDTFATLHFSSEVAEHYANLSHPLTMETAMDRGLFHSWLMEHFSQANENTHKNGWWEFINTGTTDEEDPLPSGKFLRTYSNYDYDRIVPAGTKAYIVTGYQINETTKEVRFNLKQIFVIPKRTGVILYGQANSKTVNGDETLSMQVCEIANGHPLRRDYFDEVDEDERNYLWPTCVSLEPGDDGYCVEMFGKYDLDALANHEYVVTPTLRLVRKEVSFVEVTTSSGNKKYEGELLGPWDNSESGYSNPAPVQTEIGQAKVESGYDASVLNGFYRNFYLNRYCNTASGKAYINKGGDRDYAQFVGFFRVIKSKTAPGQAFLRLKSNEYTYSEGGEVIINGDNAVYSGNLRNYQVEYNPASANELWLPTKSGYWYGDYFKPVPEGKPDMTWTDKTNWGDRENKPAGANFVPVMFDGEPEIIENSDGTATMIISVKTENEPSDNTYYNLQGVKVTNPTKGIYIQNGKKVVIK